MQFDWPHFHPFLTNIIGMDMERADIAELEAHEREMQALMEDMFAQLAEAADQGNQAFMNFLQYHF